MNDRLGEDQQPATVGEPSPAPVDPSALSGYENGSASPVEVGGPYGVVTFPEEAFGVTGPAGVEKLRAPARFLGALRRHRALSVLVGVVVVALVGGGVWWSRSHGVERPGWARSPGGAVEGYLTAVADGRADDAVAYLAKPPADRTFLTDEVLARSRTLAPLTDVVVTKVAGRGSHPSAYDDASDATVTFRIGSEAESVTFTVDEIGGYWFVDGAAQVALYAKEGYHDPVVGMDAQIQINGVTLRTDTITVFPGRYQATSDHPFVELDHQFTVKGPVRTDYGSLEPTEVTLAPSLTDDAARQIGDAARAQLDSCLAQTTFTTDCDFLAYEYVKPDRLSDPATISWSMDGSSADLPDPGTDLTRTYIDNDYVMGLSHVVVPIKTKVRCTWTDVAGQPESYDVYFSPNYYVADVTDPGHIVVAVRYRF